MAHTVASRATHRRDHLHTDLFFIVGRPTILGLFFRSVLSLAGKVKAQILTLDFTMGWMNAGNTPITIKELWDSGIERIHAGTSTIKRYRGIELGEIFLANIKLNFFVVLKQFANLG